jgi:hypothetical protein
MAVLPVLSSLMTGWLSQTGAPDAMMAGHV